MSRGELPGYDDWLDGRGNPGIPEEGPFDWMVTETVNVTQLTGDSYRIDQIDGDKTGVISIAQGPDGSQLHINGEYVELGDNFIAYISLLDDYHEGDNDKFGETRQSIPWEEGE